MMTVVRVSSLILLAFTLTVGVVHAQSDPPGMQEWLSMSAKTGTIAPGTKITMQNWQQYKQFMPLGMIGLFEGKYFLKMPADVEIDVGPPHHGILPKTFLLATEKYGSQTRLVHLPNGHNELLGYHGGIPFPNPQDPDMGTKVLMNNFFAYFPHIGVNTARNTGSFWFQDRFHNITSETFDLVARQSGWNTDPGVPADESYMPGTFFTQWTMLESPEESKYTANLQLVYKDQEAHPYPESYIFVPALRRTLHVGATARCSPIFGSDITLDDAKATGFIGGTSIFTGHVLGERTILAILDINRNSGAFPKNWDMPLGFPAPSWGTWELRDVYINDIRRIPSESAGYCYGSRVMYTDKETFWSLWNDLYDSNMKIWKVWWVGPRIRDVSGLGRVITHSSVWSLWDVQNEHATYISSNGNPGMVDEYLNSDVPKQYLDGFKYGTPGGLMSIMQ